MIVVVQRVTGASVVVEGKTVGDIDRGILALVGFEKNDQDINYAKIVDKLLNYRIFQDNEHKMNLSLKDIDGGLLLVPQFTLAANTNKGLRASFASSLSPNLATLEFDNLVLQAKAAHTKVATGVFGADMKVSLLNDGPVTFILNF